MDNNETLTMPAGGIKALKSVFGDLTTDELRQLTPKDRYELATAIMTGTNTY